MGSVADDIALVRALVEWADTNPNQIGKKIGKPNTTINRFFKGTAQHRMARDTVIALKNAYPDFPGWGDEPDHPIDTDAPIDYLPVEILPTFAGMGGGGTGEGESETALIPRYLIEDVLRGRPENFVLIRVRGNSMEPVFRQDDELLIDKRDRSPTQPGPFAMWDAEWGEYVVKNVERLPGGKVRVFSSNPEFTAFEVDNEQTNILGRPVWFGRRL